MKSVRINSKKILKILATVVIILTVLITLAIFSLRLPAIQSHITKYALNYYHQRVNAPASIGRLYVAFPSNITLEGLYLEDQQKDTLVYIDYLTIQTNLWDLLKNRISLSEIKAEGLFANVSRHLGDSSYNYQFILDAFKGGQPQNQNSQNSFTLRIEDVDLSNQRIHYQDDVNGQVITASIDRLQSQFRKFDPDTMVFELGYIKMSRASSTVKQLVTTNKTINTNRPDSISERSVKFGISQIEINQSSFSVLDQSSGTSIQTTIGQLKTTIDSMDLQNDIYKVKEILLANSSISLERSTPLLQSVQTDTTEPSTIPTLDVYLQSNSTKILKSKFSYHDQTKTDLSGFDANHIDLEEVETTITDLLYNQGEFSGNLESLSMKDANGFNLQQLSCNWMLNEDKASIHDFSLITERSIIKAEVDFQYANLDSVFSDPASINANLDVIQLAVDLNDITYFYPQWKSTFSFAASYPPFSIQGNLHGTLKDIAFNDIQIKGLTSFGLEANGRVKGLPTLDSADLEMNISRLKMSGDDLISLVPESLSQSVALPQEIAASININGKLNNFNADLDLETSLGNINYTGNILQLSDSLYGYKGDLILTRLDVGSLVKNPALGKTTINTHIDGSGFSIKDLNASLKGTITQFEYNNYDYHQINLDGNFKNKRFDGLIGSKDPNLDFDFNGLLDLNSAIPKFNFNLDLRKADLYALNITSDSIESKATVDADFTANSLESINGLINIDNLVISRNRSIHQLDKISLLSKTDSIKTDFEFKSSFLNANFIGNFQLSALQNVLRQHLNRYFNLMDSTQLTELPPQSFEFNIDFIDTDLITRVFFPQLTEFNPGKINGKYDSQNWAIDIGISINKVAYKGLEADSLEFVVTSDKQTINFDTKLAKFSSNGIDFKNVSFAGGLEANQIKADLILQDSIGKPINQFGGVLGIDNDNYTFQFLPGHLLINYQNWDVQPDNKITILKNKWPQINLSASQGIQKVTVQSNGQSGDSTTYASFSSFDLRVLGKYMDTGEDILGGTLDGQISYDYHNDRSNSNISVSHFSFKGDTIGNLSLQTISNTNETSIDLQVLDEKNNWSIAGTLANDNSRKINLNATIGRMEVNFLEGLTYQSISQLDGFLTGNLKISGTMGNPDLNGQINFNKVSLIITDLGSNINIDQQQAQLTSSGLTLNNFSIFDGKNNSMELNGTINSMDFRSFDLNIGMIAANFELMNTSEKDNRLFFGNLSVKTETTISGTLKEPKVKSQLFINEGSHITYLYPSTDIVAQDNEGIVVFYSKQLEKAGFEDYNLTTIPDTIGTFFSGFELLANINIEKGSKFTLIMDPVTDEKLTVSGNADLAYTLKPNGDMILTGRYEVSEGSYDLDFYGIAKRKFSITQGSYLLWTGDPYNATMDVTATYVISTSVPDLNVTENIPFIVNLIIKNQLLSPEITYSLALQDPGTTPTAVQSWVTSINNQESELGKQVFSLLIFRTFLPSDPFSSSNAGNLTESAARNSLSKMLTSQLNNINSKIKGIKLNFDLKSYQSLNSSANTQLELGVSKEFLNNRLVVNVAGNVGLEGAAANQNDLSNFADDIQIEYKLTKDGKLRLLGFRQNEYDDLLQGDIIQTGVGLIYVRDFNAFKELLQLSDKVPNQTP